MVLLWNKINIQYNKYSFSIRTIFFLSITFISFICLTNPFYNSQNFKNILRQLEDNPRSKGVNEICMAIKGYDLYDIKELETKVYNINNKITLRFCKNIESQDSSCIYKDGKKIIKLAGDINGSKENYNKFEVDKNEVINISSKIEYIFSCR